MTPLPLHLQALVSRDGTVATPVGWVTTMIPGKAKGEEDQHMLMPTPLLPITFDLSVHTAQSLMRMLAGKQTPSSDVSSKRRKEGDALPFAVAGKRPKFGDQDGPTTSRHLLVDKPATLKMVFNCFNAPFAVTSWTGKEHPFEKLPLESVCAQSITDGLPRPILPATRCLTFRCLTSLCAHGSHSICS